MIELHIWPHIPKCISIFQFTNTASKKKQFTHFIWPLIEINIHYMIQFLFKHIFVLNFKFLNFKGIDMEEISGRIGHKYHQNKLYFVYVYKIIKILIIFWNAQTFHLIYFPYTI